MNAWKYLQESIVALESWGSQAEIEHAESRRAIDALLTDMISHFAQCDNAHECDYLDNFETRAKALGYSPEDKSETN